MFLTQIMSFSEMSYFHIEYFFLSHNLAFTLVMEVWIEKIIRCFQHIYIVFFPNVIFYYYQWIFLSYIGLYYLSNQGLYIQF